MEGTMRTGVVTQIDDVPIHAIHLPCQQRCLHSASGLGGEVVDPHISRLPAVAQWQPGLQSTRLFRGHYTVQHEALTYSGL
jgi:hypothetical protein